MLADQAKSHLKGYGEEANLLRAIAEYVIHRNR
jgi:farnesyl diphosphate synthase